MAIPELNRPPRAQGLILVYGEGKLETRGTPSTQSARAGPASRPLGPETRLLQTSGVRAARGNPAPGFRRPALPAGAADPLGAPPGGAPTPAPGPPLRRARIQLHTLAHEETGPLTDAETALRAGLGCSTCDGERRTTEPAGNLETLPRRFWEGAARRGRCRQRDEKSLRPDLSLSEVLGKGGLLPL